MYRKNLMRVCLAAIMAATVVTTSVPVYAATEKPVEKVTAEAKSAEKAKLNVVYVLDNGRGTQVHKETVESLGAGPKDEKWTFTYGVDFNVPTGYEVSEEQDMSKVNMQVNFGGEGYLAILVKEKAGEEKAEKAKLNVVYVLDNNRGTQVHKETVESLGAGPKDEKWTFTYGVDFNVPTGYEVSEEQDMSKVNMQVNFGGEGYLAILVTEKPETVKKTTLNITFETKDGEVVGTDFASTTVQGAAGESWTFMLGTDFLLPEGYKLAEGVEQDTNVEVPFGAAAGHTVIVEKIVNEKTVYVSYIDEETKKPFENGIEEIKVASDANSFNASILKKVPAGYEVCVTGDITFEGDTVNVEVRKAEKTVYVSYIDEETKKPFENGIEEIKVAADANSFNASILKKVPAGYEVCVTGDIAFEGDTVNVEVRKAEKTVYVSYIDEETKKPFENGIEEIKVAADANSFNTSILKKVPAGYEVCVTGDIAFEGDTVNVEVRKAEKTVYVSYIDEETKMPFENGIEEIKVAADANSFNTSILKKVPAGYELCVVGDIAFEGDSLNVEVRKAERTVYVSYIDEETKIPFENGIEEIKVAKDATMFNTSLLKEVPEGYELCELGDVYIGENDTVNVEVRKLAAEEKTVYVSYIDEETKMPFENGIETIKLAKNATYFNTSLLKEVPAGYELCEVGDVYIGENDTVNVEVRKIKEEPETPVDPDKPVNPEKPVKPQEDDKDKDNQKDDKKDEDDKKSPKTSDGASPLAATATAGLSLAAILALLKKRR